VGGGVGGGGGVAASVGSLGAFLYGSHSLSRVCCTCVVIYAPAATTKPSVYGNNYY